jgi:sirohydrochlorin cobaltochelatase
MKTTIVMAAHGTPPRDFPQDELREYFSLHNRLESTAVSHSPVLEGRYEELEEKLKNWPRTAENDPFYTASNELAKRLSRETGNEVVVGFNEFCAPDVKHAIHEAVRQGADRVVVISTMMTRGGEHAERDINQAVQQAREMFPGAEIIYAWPFETGEIACFLAEHIKGFLLSTGNAH